MVLRLLIRVAVPAAIFLTSLSSIAQTIMGAGTTSCGDWLKVRNAETSNQANNRDLATSYQLQAWIDGYVSGVNTANGLNSNTTDILTSHPSGNALRAFVDNYCRSKPLDPVASAAVALVKELRSRAEQK